MAVEVRNFGKSPRRGVTGEVEVGKAGETTFVPAHAIPLPPIASLAAGKSALVEVRHVFPEPGRYPLRVRLENDRLERDDESFVVVTVREGLEVVVVDGDPSAERFGGESGYMLAALSPRGDAPSGVLPRRLVGELSGESLEGADVVLVLNRYGLSPSEKEVLADFAGQGGGLGFFLGNRVEPERYRELAEVFHGGEEEIRLFPAAFREVGPAGESGVQSLLSFENFDHPAFELFRGLEGSSLEEVMFAHYFALHPLPGATVIAHFDDPDATPAIIEASAGKGRVVVFNTSADRDWSDWPTDPSYPIVLQEWVRYLAPGRSEEATLEAGMPFSWEVTPGMA